MKLAASAVFNLKVAMFGREIHCLLYNKLTREYQARAKKAGPLVTWICPVGIVFVDTCRSF